MWLVSELWEWVRTNEKELRVEPESLYIGGKVREHVPAGESLGAEKPYSASG